MKEKFEIDTNEGGIFKKSKGHTHTKSEEKKIARRLTIAFTNQEYDLVEKRLDESSFSTMTSFVRYVLLEYCKDKTS